MSDFIEWLDHPATPAWVLLVAITVATLVCMIAILVSIALIVKGYWIIPLLFWIVLPSYVVIKMYLESKKGNDNA